MIYRATMTAGKARILAAILSAGLCAPFMTTAAHAAVDGSSRAVVQAKNTEVPFAAAARAASARRADHGDEALNRLLHERLGPRAEDVSVSIHDRRTGIFTRFNPGQSNCTGSIVKVMVLVQLLRQHRADGETLSDSERSQARRMITMSDNDATDALFRRVGGRSGVQRLADRLGMTRTTVLGAWGRTETTAADQNLLMDRIIDGQALSDPADREFVLDLMGKVVPEQAWGVGSIPDEADAVLKNGWVPLTPRGWRVNSIGRVTGPGIDYSVAMLSWDNDSEAEGVELLDAASDVIYRYLKESSANADGGQRPELQLPPEAPSWLESPGAAFPPYPAW